MSSPPSAPAPTFGKRNRPPSRIVPAASQPTLPADHAEVLAALREEVAAAYNERPRVVPRSFKAAFLAGLVVGCGLIGLDIATIGRTAREAAAMLDPATPTGLLFPSLILVGVVGGGRAAATSLLVGHALLAKAELTGYPAYMAAGAGAALAFAAALFLVTGSPPVHGWIVEAVAGGAAGFCYRLFAGARLIDTT